MTSPLTPRQVAAVLKALIAEATKHARSSRREFEKYDNSEDMHAMEQWEATVAWLKDKLADPEPKPAVSKYVSRADSSVYLPKPAAKRGIPRMPKTEPGYRGKR